jgi:hypothetical protein
LLTFNGKITSATRLAEAKKTVIDSRIISQQLHGI